jgi:hypothetical protein
MSKRNNQAKNNSRVFVLKICEVRDCFSITLKTDESLKAKRAKILRFKNILIFLKQPINCEYIFSLDRLAALIR